MINHEFTITGSSTAFFRLAMHLRATGHEIQVFPINPANDPMRTRYVEQGIEIAETVVLSDVDLVIANTICSAELVIQIGPLVPTIWFINEAEVALRMLMRNTSLLQAFALPAAIIYNMPFQHDVFRSFTYQLDPGKFHTASFGVDLDPGTFERDKVPAKSKPYRIVQVGTIERRKRPGDFVRAVARSGLDIEAVICGKFVEMDNEAQMLVAANPQTYRLLEGLSDGEVMAWVESSDMFCLASDSETQSLAAYEAALLSKPMILSDLPCYRGIFAHGKNCLMFPPLHVDLLALTMSMYVASPSLREEMGRNAQKTASRYGNAQFFARFDAIMASVMG